MKYSLILTALAAIIPATTVWSHSPAKQASGPAKKTISAEEKTVGREGDPKLATRTIRVDMSDALRYSPSQIIVKQGETVRFVVKNNGKTLHEMVLGTPAELEEHAALMMKFPNMEHDEPNQLHVKPGGTGEMVWQFTRAGEFSFGCLIPGHFESGMVGRITVVR